MKYAILVCLGIISVLIDPDLHHSITGRGIYSVFSSSVSNMQHRIVYSPGQRIDIKRLTILSMTPASDANFYVADMEAISEHPEVDTLLLKVVTCPLGHLPSDATYDVFPAMEGFQHLAVVPANSELEIMLEAKAALPCPPHCGGSKLWLTLADYLKSH